MNRAIMDWGRRHTLLVNRGSLLDAPTGLLTSLPPVSAFVSNLTSSIHITSLVQNLLLFFKWSLLQFSLSRLCTSDRRGFFLATTARRPRSSNCPWRNVLEYFLLAQLDLITCYEGVLFNGFSYGRDLFDPIGLLQDFLLTHD